MKRDIKSLPFAELSEAIKVETKDTMSNALELRRAALASIQSKETKRIVKDLIDSGRVENTEGIYEATYEAINMKDPDSIELTSAELKECINRARTKCVNDFITDNEIAESHVWFLPQMIAHFGNWKAVKKDGKYHGGATVEANYSEFNNGLLALVQSPRTSLIAKNVKLPMYKLGTYNHLVPLVMAGFKKIQNIPYSAWERSIASLRPIVDKDLGEAMLSELPNITTENLLIMRTAALTYETGKNIGKVRDPKTSAMLYRLYENDIALDHGIDKLPKLAQVMLAQIWCAHPENRTAYMILDPSDWSNIPDPLVDTQVLSKSKYSGSVEAYGW